MEFFNRKEEVIDIQLTQYGKHLLSKGEFAPRFYAFYDDDVIYDTSYAGFGEHSPDAENRMMTTPRVKAQYAFEGAETRMKRVTQTDATKNLSNDEKAAVLQQVIPTSTRVSGLSADLGTSAFTSSRAPAWNVRLLDGMLSDSVFYTTGSIKAERIPQLNVVSKTRVSSLTSDEVLGELVLDEHPGHGDSYLDGAEEAAGLQLVESFEDGSSFQVLSDTIIFDIEEFHTTNRDFNFDVEVFEVETGENGNEELRILKFPPSGDSLIRGLSMETDGDVVSNLASGDVENENFVQYYIDVNVDRQVQIPLNEIGTGLREGRRTAVIPENAFDCPDDEVDESGQAYSEE